MADICRRYNIGYAGRLEATSSPPGMRGCPQNGRGNIRLPLRIAQNEARGHSPMPPMCQVGV